MAQTKIKHPSDLSDIELREAVAREVMGYNVLGEADVAHIEGEDSVCEEGMFRGFTTRELVYLNDCVCGRRDPEPICDDKALGHLCECLLPIIRFEESMVDVLQVIGTMRENGWRFEMKDRRKYAG